MRRVPVLFALVFCALGLTISAHAQSSDPAITTTRVFGKVTSIDAPAGLITVKTEAGSVVSVKLDTNTIFERMPPGETKADKAVKIELKEIAVGDGIYARGFVAEDRKSVPAQKVIVVSQSEIAQKQERERAEWRKRGLSGIIESLNPQTKEITVTTRTAEGSKPIIVPVSDKVEMRRYAPDSVKFSDAKKSKWDDLKVGDQLRAKGDRSTDGVRFTPEEIVTGAFRTLGGSIVSVDAATGEIKINDIQTKQPLTIVVNKDSTMKRVPADFMQMMAQRQQGGGAGPGQGGAPASGGGAAAPAQGSGTGTGGGERRGPPPSGAQAGNNQSAQGGQAAARQGSGPGSGGGPGGAAGNGPGAGGPGGLDIQRIIENLPPVTLAELKAGDMVLVSSTKGADPSRATAITLVSGVEPIFNMLQARQGGPPNRPPNLGTINIGIGGP